VIKSFPFLETTRNKMLRVIGSEKVRASLYLSRQDLGLAKKTVEETMTQQPCHQKQ